MNNIHALVDIDPETARESIVELSRMMRDILYEDINPTITLAKEVDFLSQYIYLMRMRYSDTLKVETVFSESTFGVEIPPLLFVSFVENAFKHGVSYERTSFIKVNMVLFGQRLKSSCVNSRGKPG